MRPDKLRAVVVRRGTECLGRWWVGSQRRCGASQTTPHRPRLPPSAATSLPIFYDKCVGCHRPGEVAPMSLITYRDVRPWASAIREKVTTRVMPPWHADRQYGSFRNDLSLTQREIDTIAAWVKARRQRGQSVRASGAARSSPMAGRLGTPDQVFEMQADYQVPAYWQRSTTSTSRSRPASPRTSGCRQVKCARAIARTCITSSCT